MNYQVTLFIASHGMSYYQYPEGRLISEILFETSDVDEASRFVDNYHVELEDGMEKEVVIVVDTTEASS